MFRTKQLSVDQEVFFFSNIGATPIYELAGPSPFPEEIINDVLAIASGLLSKRGIALPPFVLSFSQMAPMVPMKRRKSGGEFYHVVLPWKEEPLELVREAFLRLWALGKMHAGEALEPEEAQEEWERLVSYA